MYRTSLVRLGAAIAAAALMATALTGPVSAAPAAVEAPGTASEPAVSVSQGLAAGKKPAATTLTNVPTWIYKGVNLLLKVTSLIGGKDVTIDRKLDDISRQIAALSADVRRGFDQLEIDIANSKYAAAQDELRPVTTQATKGIRYLEIIGDPATTDAARAEAQIELTEHCATVTVDTPELMQMYYGDPGDSMSQNGLLPAAWEVIIAGERAAQRANPGAMPVFLSYRSLRQMNLIGEMSEGRIAQYAIVRGVCRALKFSDPNEQQRAATTVRDLIVNGDKDTPGLTAVDASLPAQLPRRTGVFPGSTVGAKGLVVGNFNLEQNINSGGRAQIFSVPWGAPLIGRAVIASSVTIYADGRIRNENETTPESTNVCLSSAPTGGFVSAYPVDFVPCDAKDPAQKFILEEGQIRLGSDRSKCVTQRRLEAEYGGALETRDCDTLAPYWWLNGPIPGAKDLTDRRLYVAASQGSPTGDNPASASGPWSREWTYIKNEWMDEVQKDVAATGSSLEALSNAYGGPTSEWNVRILPFHQVGWKDLADHGWVWNSGPSGAPSGPLNDTRITSVKMDGTKPATTVNWKEVAVYTPQASNYFFGVPVTGCAYRFERPKVGGFDCPTRK